MASQAITEPGDAKLRIFDFKTTWPEFQKPSQTTTTKAKPRGVQLILKPHVQSFINSLELVPSSYVC